MKKLRRITRPARRLSRRDWVLMAAGAVLALAVVEGITLASHARTAIPYQSAGIDAPWIPSTVKYWKTPINDYAKQYNIDPNFIAIIMTMESGGYAQANSGEADGLMQITPVTAKDIASMYLKKPVTTYNLWDPRTNIEFGVAYLAHLRDTYGSYQQGPSWDSTVELVAAAYNGGYLAANHLEEGKGLHDTQSLVYSRDAFNMWRERHTGDSPTFDRWKERGGSTLIDAAKQHNQ